MLVLREDMEPCAPGEIGDLYIAGVGPSPGYWRDPEKEKARAAFVADPRDRGRRIYRSGDLGWRGDDGLFYDAGRADSQIKHRGYRIELGEIEAALNASGDVRECVRSSRSPRPGSRARRSAGAEVIRGGAARVAQCAGGEAARLHATLELAYPRQATQESERQDRSRRRATEIRGRTRVGAMNDAVESGVLQVFREGLGIEVVSPDMDMIDSGLLDSLALVTLVVELEQRFSIAIRFETLDIDDFRTVKSIARVVEASA